MKNTPTPWTMNPSKTDDRSYIADCGFGYTIWPANPCHTTYDSTAYEKRRVYCPCRQQPRRIAGSCEAAYELLNKDKAKTYAPNSLAKIEKAIAAAEGEEK